MSAAERHDLQPIAMRVKDAVAISGIARANLYLRMAEGKLESVKVGKARLILRESLERLLTPAKAA